MALAVATTALALYLASALGWTRDSVYLVDFSCFNPPERCVAPAHGPAAGCRARHSSFLRFCSVLSSALCWGRAHLSSGLVLALCMSVLVLARSKKVCLQKIVQSALCLKSCHGVLWELSRVLCVCASRQSDRHCVALGLRPLLGFSDLTLICAACRLKVSRTMLVQAMRSKNVRLAPQPAPSDWLLVCLSDRCLKDKADEGNALLSHTEYKGVPRA